MDAISRLFDLLDDWRHLPDYQLERRADIFFAMYLPAFLASRLGINFNPEIIPEFPVRIGTINPDLPINKSKKIDYLIVSRDASQAVFVELKTDSGSRRSVQDEYLVEAHRVGVAGLIDGLMQIVCATDQKHKYACLLRLLERNRLIKLPPDLDSALASAKFKSEFNRCVPKIEIVRGQITLQILYIQPVATLPDEIGFEEFAHWLDAQHDVIAPRFAASLRQWGGRRAGRL